LEWDTPAVMDMPYLFYSHCSTLPTFNQPLNARGVSSDEFAGYVFFAASLFNQPFVTWYISREADVGNTSNGAFKF
jgi:hypothetical protein